MTKADTYALRTVQAGEVAAPDLPYQPPMPRAYRPRIGLVGAGGIAQAHLDAYRSAGWEVAAICARRLTSARSLAHFAPGARLTDRLDDLLDDPTIDVIDLTPHPADRLPLIEAALRAGKHVLSQKPFVLDLAEGERLVALAADKGVHLAVNQNGRWAPHLAWMRAAVQAGLLGQVTSAEVAITWNHNWIAGTKFDLIPDIVLYDFGIHWFDFVASLNLHPETVYATATRAMGQTAKAPLMAQALIAHPKGQASLTFNGAASFAPQDRTTITGTHGTLHSIGPDLGQQAVSLTTAAGLARPALTGTWFNDGFRGAMGALLCAIEDGTEPANAAAGNLASLALAFAAIASRRTGREVAVGSVTRLEM